MSKFSVRKYRSITDTHAIELSNWTVLVGPNNEGKSNLVRALATALDLAKDQHSEISWLPFAARRPRPDLSGRGRAYNWEMDFPVGLREAEPDGETTFKLWFRLDDNERREFRRRTGSRLQTDLPLEIRAGRDRVAFHVRLQGRGSQTLQAQKAKIAEFIGSRLEIAHIPAVRTADDAAAVVARQVALELKVAERDRAYQTALRKIDELQEPILRGVEQAIERTLKDFLPNVRSVSVSVPPEDRSRALRSAVSIVIDDGTATPLSYKGDGVQSLAALSLLRSASHARARGRDLILAIEEPESHLHPGAVHQLRKVLRELAETSQVVMTTHHPVFVDRARPGSNVIVQGGRARSARSMNEIRECLGIEASDNLRDADFVVLVEGESDKIALSAILPARSPAVRSALQSGRLAIEFAGGADRLPTHVAVLRNNLREVHAVLDADSAGRVAARRCVESGHLLPSEHSLMSFRGTGEAEQEDVYRVEAYSDEVARHWAVRLPCPEFNHARSKWSGRMAAAFQAQGQDWEGHATEVKLAVARAVAANPTEAIQEDRAGPLNSLVERLESSLTSSLPSTRSLS